MPVSIIALLFLSFSSMAKELPEYLKMNPQEDIDQYNEMLMAIKTTHNIKRTVENATNLTSTYSSSSSDCNSSVLPSDPRPQHNLLCDFEGVTEQWKTNCDKLVESDKIPRGALEFTLNAMKKNSTNFATNRCFDKVGLSHSSHYSMGGTKANDIRQRMENGLNNKCQFIINDMKDRSRGKNYGNKCFAKLYYVDLCSKKSGASVTKSISRIGTGTCIYKRGYQNKSGKGTTTLGAFVTNDHVFNKGSSNPKYIKLRREMKKLSNKGIAYSVQLFGLQNSNNGASRDKKYLHITPHESSLGCPSINGEDYWMINELAKNGPSLVVNYHEGKMEDINKCSE